MAHADEKTLDFYEQNSLTYSTRKPRPEDEKDLERFMSELPVGAVVCDLGCGNGWAAAKLIENGFSVTAIDGSSGLVKEAKRIYGLDVSLENFDDFSYCDRFDGLWSSWALHHTTRKNFPSLLERISKGVRAGGLMFFSLKGGTSDERDERDRLYAQFSEAELREIIQRSLSSEIIDHRSWEADATDRNVSLRHATLLRIL